MRMPIVDYPWTRPNGTDAKDFDNYVQFTECGNEVEMDEQPIEMAHVAFRVYTNKVRVERNDADARGTYDGLEETFDEWIPVYSSRIQPYLSRLNNLRREKVDQNEALD